MVYKGSCHCRSIEFEVEGNLESAVECNCSHCSRKGYLLWFVPRAQLKLKADEDVLKTYRFNTHKIEHRFCSNCGCAPIAFGVNNGIETASINVRCLENVNLDSVKRMAYDGKSL